MRRITLAIVVLASGIGGAAACSCRPIPYAELVARTPLIFEAVVENSALDDSDHGPERIVTLTVKRQVKGSIPVRVLIRTAASTAACGWDPRVGTTHRVGAYRMYGRYRTDLCTMLDLNRRRAEGS
jgi:hypothetical protein